MSDDLPEPDRIDGAPHPRETARLIGQSSAEADFLSAYNAGRLHSGWLITGPRGVGKATLAYRIARFLRATPVEDGGGLFGDPEPITSLDIDYENPIARRIRSGAESGIFILRRANDEKTGKLRSQITVDEARKLKNFFALSATDGGRRVVIVDAADEMNVNAANAILKVLEEPPALTTILLICHQPSRLLPTIRSRCRELRLSPLAAADMEAALVQAGAEPDVPASVLSELSAGSVGEAVRLANMGGFDMYQSIVDVMRTLPRMDRQAALRLAETIGARGADDHIDMGIGLIELFIARVARAGAVGQIPPEAAKGEAEVIARLAPDPIRARAFAETLQEASARMRQGRAVNLDPVALILDTMFKIQATAAS